MFIKIWRKVRQELKKEVELNKNIKRLARVPFDYELLQNMIDATANSTTNVEIKITLKDGSVIELKPTAKKGTEYVSFKEKYEKARR